jgi:hypothetical protein
MTLPISMSRRIAAAPQPIHAIIADYHDGHRRIVPPRVFKWLGVEKGGIGAGTEIRFAMRVMGSTRVSRGIVTEPEPGRTIVETYPETGIVTTFRIEPAGASESVVTITTDLRLPDGLIGKVQGFFTGRLLRPLYVEELQRLADIVEGRHQHDPVPTQSGA